jgi:hypothetical protein
MVLRTASWAITLDPAMVLNGDDMCVEELRVQSAASLRAFGWCIS